ncbi:MAG TPA: response regulator [Rhizomicrobium sp.]|jgi:DNA-binding response OmpR family regulator|nr:response regulator [Rhizomicrobium sp.]
MARIEIIDDDPAVRESLTLLLEADGYDVRAAESGDIGLALARDFQPHVVLTDIIMPGCEGIETILALKSQHPKMKIIAMSGGGRVGNTDYLELARKMGADTSLEKPFDDEALLQAVRVSAI